MGLKEEYERSLAEQMRKRGLVKTTEAIGLKETIVDQMPSNKEESTVEAYAGILNPENTPIDLCAGDQDLEYATYCPTCGRFLDEGLKSHDDQFETTVCHVFGTGHEVIFGRRIHAD